MTDAELIKQLRILSKVHGEGYDVVLGTGKWLVTGVLFDKKQQVVVLTVEKKNG